MRAVRGDRVPYDSAVITNLPTYRLEGQKFKAAQNLIVGQRTEIDSLKKQIVIKMMIDSTQSTAVARLEKSAERNEKAFTELSGKFDKLLTEAEKPKPLYQRPWFLIVIGAAGGWALSR